MKSVSMAKEIAERPFSMQAAIAINAAAGPTQGVIAWCGVKSTCDSEGDASLGLDCPTDELDSMVARQDFPDDRFANLGEFAIDPVRLRERVPAIHHETAILRVRRRRSNGRE